MNLPTDSKQRKETPVVTGVLDYFPLAIAAVARVSFKGNEKHNPGQSLHWSRDKSTDHADCIGRHLVERFETNEESGESHAAHIAWRALAMLQLAEEKRLGGPEAPIVETGDFEYDEARRLAGRNHLDLDSFISGPGRVTISMIHTLQKAGFTDDVIELIVGGTSFAKDWEPGTFVYIAGPMRGYPEFNFPAFDKARDLAFLHGYNVISPADIDRAAGVSETTDPAAVVDSKPFAYRDFAALFLIASTPGGAIAMLPGWEKSTGATAEFFLARWLGLKILDAEHLVPLQFVQLDNLWISMRSYLTKQEAK